MSLVHMLGFGLIAPLCLLAALGVGVTAPAQLPKGKVMVHRLVHAGPGGVEKAVELDVGDMLQLEPFSYPLVPKFLGAKLKVELKGDQILEPIGQSDASMSQREGRSGRSIFLHVRGKGQTDVALVLVNDEDLEIPGYRASYQVQVKEK